MRVKTILIAVLCAVALTACHTQPRDLNYATIEKKGDVLWKDSTETGLADGAHVEYINLRSVTRPDFRIVQDGGSGTIVFAVSASWTPNTTAAAATYDDIGLDFYGAATFAAATTKLLDDGRKLRTAIWLKIVFTVAGASADASYTLEQALELSGD